MTKLKLGILLAVVSLATVPFGLAQAQTAAGSVGTAIIWDDAALGDAITYTLADISQPPPGTEYVGWLVSDDGSAKLNTGAMAVSEDGGVAHVFDSGNSRYAGANLIASYSKVVITTEVSGSNSNDIGGTNVYSSEISADTITHVRHLVAASPTNSAAGILTDLKAQLDVAIASAGSANNANTLADVLRHTQAVINVIEGTGGSNYGLSYNTETFDADPGDGVGILGHSLQSQTHGELAGASLVVTNAGNVEAWAEGSRDAALSVLTQTDVAIAKLPLASAIGFLNSARSGVDADGDGSIESISGEGGADQAYVEAQLAATFNLSTAPPPKPVPTATAVPTATPKPEPTPVPPAPTATPRPKPRPTNTPFPTPPAPTATPMPSLGIALPNVGEPAIPLTSKFVLIASVLLCISGGVLIVRRRRSDSKI